MTAALAIGRVAVIGGGIIGASAAKYLALQGADITLFAPGEPATMAQHKGPFASHYDAGRITRTLSPNPVWAELAQKSIHRYRNIEAESGIDFFHETGLLVTATDDSTYMRDVRAVVAASDVDAVAVTTAKIAARFPYLALPDGHVGFVEGRGAGFIDPRRFIAAQIALVRSHGGRVVDAPVLGLHAGSADVTCTCDSGQQVFDHVIVAGGAFCNAILPDPVPLRVLGRTIGMAVLEPDEVARLAGMPSLIYREPDNSDPYLVPPTRYPDGSIRLKIGGEPVERVITGRDALTEWFQGPGDPAVGAFLRNRMEGLFPGLTMHDYVTAPCAVTYTETGLPYIDHVDPRIVIATGGCGAAGKSGDEIGRIACETLCGQGDPRFSLPAKSG